MDSNPMIWNFEELSESDSLGTSSAGSETDPISSLLSNIVREQNGMSLGSAAGGRVQHVGGGFCGGLAPTPPPAAQHHHQQQQQQQQQLAQSAPAAALVYPNSARLGWAEGCGALGPLGPTADLGQAPQHHAPQHHAQQQQQHHHALFHPAACALPPAADLFHLVRCPVCNEHFRDPRVLACFHSFCKRCLEAQDEKSAPAAAPKERPNCIVCPQCRQETQLSPSLGIDGLLSDYGLQNAVLQTIQQQQQQQQQQLAPDDNKHLPRAGSLSSSPGSDSDELFQSTPPADICNGCKTGNLAQAFCTDCQSFLCQVCTNAHNTMHCFDGHRVENIARGEAKAPGSPKAPQQQQQQQQQQCNCLEHRQQPLQYFCITCNFAICQECTLKEHTSHSVEKIDDVAEDQMHRMEELISEASRKQAELHDVFRLIDTCQTGLTASFQRAQCNVDDLAHALVQAVQEARKLLHKDLETTFACRQLQITVIDKEVQKMTKKMSQTIEFTQRLLKYSSPTEVMVFKPLLDQRLQNFLSFNVDGQLAANADIEGMQCNGPQARQLIYTCMLNARPDSWVPSHTMPGLTQLGHGGAADAALLLRGGGSPNGNDSAIGSSCNNLGFVGSNSSSSSSSNNNRPLTSSPLGALSSNAGSFHNAAAFTGSSAPVQSFMAALEASNNNNNGGGAAAAVGGGGGLFNSQYEKWSSGLELTASAVASALELGGSAPASAADLEDKAAALALNAGGAGGGSGGYPPRSQIKRQKMTYHCKFGEFGVMEGQFTEPSGVAVSAQNDIIVADTNNHRIQVFNKEGHFKFQFGECGKRDGQLLYPNRVSVNRTTGDFIVTERSPTHQIQVYNQYGQFLRKFGANILQHPRGVCVDGQGRIIVVECKVMRVLIFDMFGNVLHKFSCSRYLEFPNGVCANDKNEIFISDNRAHCIKVFSYEGQYLRQIGGEGVTNYPIGVGINSFGEVVVADNHNNFNLTIFNQSGELLTAMESKVKHAQCFDVALLEDGSVVLASKDYRLYLYRYQAGQL